MNAWRAEDVRAYLARGWDALARTATVHDPAASLTLAGARREQACAQVPGWPLPEDRLARMKRRLDCARMLCWRAAWMADLDLPNAKEASMAKAAGGQAAVQTCIDAIEIVGAEATCEDGEHALLAKWFRDIKVFDIFEGTGQIQRIVISKRIFETIKSF